MFQASPESSPPLAKQSIISQHLRNRIIEGKYPLGGRLPTQIQLVEQYRVSGVTIQRVMNRLNREGFIRTRGRSGTFVSTHPPHLFNYAVVFHDKPMPGQHRSRYHEMLEAEILRLQRAGDRRLTTYNGMLGHEHTKVFRQLLAKLRSNQMAGLLLIDGDVFSHTPLVEETGICRAAIMSCNAASIRCPFVFPDMREMIDLALNTLLARGRRRIATLSSAPVHENVGSHLRQAMQARGIAICDRWMQIIPHEIPEAARNNVILMMSPGRERPDGIFIVDDNLVEGALAGLVAVNDSPDVEIVAHCNLPRKLASPVPMHRVGFETSKIVQTAINLIDQQRIGKPVPAVTRVEPVLQAWTGY